MDQRKWMLKMLVERKGLTEPEAIQFLESRLKKGYWRECPWTPVELEAVQKIVVDCTHH